VVVLDSATLVLPADVLPLDVLFEFDQVKLALVHLVSVGHLDHIKAELFVRCEATFPCDEDVLACDYDGVDEAESFDGVG
jgi:hypothetical protein